MWKRSIRRKENEAGQDHSRSNEGLEVKGWSRWSEAWKSVPGFELPFTLRERSISKLAYSCRRKDRITWTVEHVESRERTRPGQGGIAAGPFHGSTSSRRYQESLTRRPKGGQYCVWTSYNMHIALHHVQVEGSRLQGAHNATADASRMGGLLDPVAARGEFWYIDGPPRLPLSGRLERWRYTACVAAIFKHFPPATLFDTAVRSQLLQQESRTSRRVRPTTAPIRLQHRSSGGGLSSSRVHGYACRDGASCHDQAQSFLSRLASIVHSAEY